MANKATIERNQKIDDYLSSLYKLAKDGNYTTNQDSYFALLNNIFNSSTISYREIVLVALVGRMLDDNYRACSKFYSCKPRGIYDNGPIKVFLLENGFPHSKSGPLNIAKASNIDEAWSRQRDDREGAENVVELIRMIDDGSEEIRKDIGVDLMRMYISIAEHVKNLIVNIQPSSDPAFLSHLCSEMIKSAPDSGNTPQRIFGYLLESHHQSIGSTIIVSGTEDSASATSTTSKKPGDINEEGKDGTIYNVYEVTVKKFDRSRILDSYDCVKKYNDEHKTEIKEIIVVCRKQDCIPEMKKSGLNFCMGSFEYKDVIYHYWNIYEWITYTLEHMIPSARNTFYHKLNDYINNPNTHKKVKVLWKQLNSSK